MQDDPLDTPLPCDVRFPGVAFSKGVKLRTLVEAATRWKQKADAEVRKTLPPDAGQRMRDLLRREAGYHVE